MTEQVKQNGRSAGIEQAPVQAAEEQPVDEPGRQHEAPPQKQPLTPDALERENRQGDRAIALLVTLLGIGLGAFTIADTSIWRHLKTGWYVQHVGIPRTDTLSFATEGQRWIADSWLYDWALYRGEQIESRRNALALATRFETELHRRSEPIEEEGITRPAVTEEGRQQVLKAIAGLRQAARSGDTTQMRWAAEELIRAADEADIRLAPTPDDTAALITLKWLSVARAACWGLIVAVLLTLRHAGPTLWWTAVCVALALVSLLSYVDSGPINLTLLFLAIELAVLHRATTRGAGWLWLLIPLFALWANVHTWFALGVLVAWLFVMGETLVPPDQVGDRKRPLQWRSALVPVAVATAATFLTPYGPLVWVNPLQWASVVLEPEHFQGTSRLFLVDLGFVPIASARFVRQAQIPPALAACALTVILAAVSFWLPRVPFSLGRLLLLVTAVALSAVAVRNLPLTSMLATFVLILNGQEWFLNRFGTQTRISRPWVLWSRLGRVVTVLVLLVFSFLALSGRVGVRVGRMGWGLEWGIYDVPLAREVRQLGLHGRLLNTTPLQGDLLLWYNRSTDNNYQVFFDSRLSLHRPRLEEIYDFFLRMSRAEVTTEELNEMKVTAVALNRRISPVRPSFENTFRRLSDSPDWVLVDVAPTAAVFARIDSAVTPDLSADVELAKKRRVDPSQLAFKQHTRRIPELPPGPPPPIRPPTLIDRLWPFLRVNRHVESFRAHHWMLVSSELPGPAECLLAMRTARRATAAAPASPTAWYAYYQACSILLQHERAIARTQLAVHQVRIQELLAALDQIVSLVPNWLEPRLALAYWYEQLGYVDLAAEHYGVALQLISPSDPGYADVQASYNQLQAMVDEMRRTLADPENMLPSPELRAQVAAGRGFLKLAIEQITQERGPVGSGDVDSGILSDYYIRAGLVADAFDTLLQMRSASALERMTPGLFEEKWGMVHLMRGDYRRAKRYWESSLAKQRHALAEQKIQAMQSLLFADPQASIDRYFQLTAAIQRQAATEYHLGFVNLEMGEPLEAAKHFRQSLQLAPDNPYRPLIAYYLEQITGEKIEPRPRPASQRQDGRAATPTATPEAQPVSERTQR